MTTARKMGFGCLGIPESFPLMSNPVRPFSVRRLNE
jgi:hypothetical protein